MKTTIDLPEEMLHQAKRVAAHRRISLKDLIIEGLLHVSKTDQDVTGQKRREAMQRFVLGLRACNTQPMVPLKRDEIHAR